MTRRRRGRRRSKTKRSGGILRAFVGATAVVALVAVGAYLAVGEVDDATAVRAPAVWSEGRVRVEVLNGGGVTGMARAATQVLRRSGFDVVDFGNAPVFDSTRSSEVVDRVGRTDIARAVADALGIDNVHSDPDPNLFVDVTVVVGRAWTEPVARSGGEPGEGGRNWWDPREWFGT